MRCAFQYSNHVIAVSGSTKNCISICSNSRVRKMKFPGVISLRNAFPICAMPNGTFCRDACCTLRKLTKMPCAVSGRRYTVDALSSTAPMNVLNMRLNWRGSVSWQSAKSPGRLLGLRIQRASSSLSARKRPLHVLQSTSGSTKPATWPLASQTRGFIRMDASSPSTSSRERTIVRHQWSLMFFLSSTPSGP